MWESNHSSRYSGSNRLNTSNREMVEKFDIDLLILESLARIARPTPANNVPLGTTRDFGDALHRIGKSFASVVEGVDDQASIYDLLRTVKLQAEWRKCKPFYLISLICHANFSPSRPTVYGWKDEYRSQHLFQF